MKFRYLQRCPQLILTSSAINYILECGLAAASLEHRDAHDSTLIVFCDLIECSRYREVSGLVYHMIAFL